MSEIPETPYQIEQTTNDAPKRFTKNVSQNEYVAGGYYDIDVNRVLQKNSDTLKRTFGDGIVAKMLRDPEIKKCETILKIAVLNDGITFFPAVSRPADVEELPEGTKESPEQKKERLTREKELKRYEQAVKYANFATRAIDNLDSPIRSIMECMLDAISYGNKVAEQTYKEQFDSDFGRTLLTLDSIRVKPRENTKFVVNKFNKLIGFAAAVQENGVTKQKILPREKFLVLTFRGKDGDPRGTSILEAVYNAWYLKMQLWPEYLRWLLQCAIPSLVGYTSDTADTKNVLRDATTNAILKDSLGNVLYESDVSGLLNALVQLRSASAIALPHGAKVEPITNQVSGDPFKGMRDVLNEEIEMGMILQTLASSEGRFMSRAASQSHMSILDLFVFFIKGLVIDMITQDLLKPLMKLNFADFDMTLLPKVSMGDSERRDWATDVIAIAALFKSGFIGPSQLVGYDKIISAPERDVKSDRAQAQAVSDALAEQKATPTSPTSTPKTPANRNTVAGSFEAKIEALKELVSEYETLHGDII